MDLFATYQQALPYPAFLEQHANDNQRARWSQVYEQVLLTDSQRTLLTAFRRPMPVLCLAGAWCGDCVNQCPIFERFQAVAPTISMRYADRDLHAEAQRELRINGGNRVPVLVFFSEDGQEVARFGERTLSKYRQMVRDLEGAACPVGLAIPGDALLPDVVQDWLDEFERVQWILRLSPRLRQLHGD